jgi:DNA-binding CsgD family transcriptional regulator
MNLTPRERELITLVKMRLRNKVIAEQMYTTEGVIKNYLGRLNHAGRDNKSLVRLMRVIAPPIQC